MRAKTIVTAIAALVPVVYCGGLVFHFYDMSGSVEDATSIGLGPTLLGLTIVGGLFCIPLMLKVSKLFAGPQSSDPDEPAPDDKSGIDADAIVARYMAQRSAEASASPPAPRATRETGGQIPTGQAKPAGFGRKSR